MTFREYLTEIEVDSQMNAHLDLVKRSLHSSVMNKEVIEGMLHVEYDVITLVFNKEGYLVGFKEDSSYYKTSPKLKSLKDLNKRTASKFLDRVVKKVKDLKTTKVIPHTYFPKTKNELRDVVKYLIKKRGNKAYLNDIDVSSVTSMYGMFDGTSFDGDISKWDVSNVTNMGFMFYNVSFNGDISKWNVSNVENMEYMFSGSSFDGDISKWNVSSVKNMGTMFERSSFDGDISKWDVSNVKEMDFMFSDSKFNGDISKWNVSSVKDMSFMFSGSSFDGDISKWNVYTTKKMSAMFDGSPTEGNEPNWYRRPIN